MNKKVEKQKFEEAVKTAKINEIFQIGKEMPYKNFSFDCDDGGEFSWVAERNYDVLGSVGYVFPLRSSNMVKSFKTLDGAKRNMLRYFSWIFE